jgi:hypothetical protein
MEDPVAVQIAHPSRHVLQAMQYGSELWLPRPAAEELSGTDGICQGTPVAKLQQAQKGSIR